MKSSRVCYSPPGRDLVVLVVLMFLLADSFSVEGTNTRLFSNLWRDSDLRRQTRSWKDLILQGEICFWAQFLIGSAIVFTAVLDYYWRIERAFILASWFFSESLYFLSRLVSALLCCCFADRGGFYNRLYNSSRWISRYWGLKNGEQRFWASWVFQFLLLCSLWSSDNRCGLPFSLLKRQWLLWLLRFIIQSFLSLPKALCCIDTGHSKSFAVFDWWRLLEV